MPNKPKETEAEEIRTFDEYVRVLCPGIHPDEAKSHAAYGERLLRLLTSPEDLKMFLAKMRRNDDAGVGTYVLWCLIKKAYDSGKNFGKGTFTIAYENQEQAHMLYDLIGTSNVLYNRDSTHFNQYTSEHKGIDIAKNSRNIPRPWRFRTLCIGFCQDAPGGPFVYLKPETYGVNFKEDPYEALLHGLALVRHKIAPEKIPGTREFRESEENPVAFPWQIGNEVCLMITAKDGIIERTPDEILSKVIRPLANEFSALINSIPNEGPHKGLIKNPDKRKNAEETCAKLHNLMNNKAVWSIVPEEDQKVFIEQLQKIMKAIVGKPKVPQQRPPLRKA